MNFFKSLVEAAELLSDNQKGLLISIYASATPSQAYEVSIGTEQSVETKQQLIKLGLLSENNNQVYITSLGKDALYKNNLIDQLGEITDFGKSTISEFEQSKDQRISLESFELFKSFYQ